MDVRTETSRARRARGLLAALTAIALACLLVAPAAWASPEDFGLESTSTSVSIEQAGAHADFETRFHLFGNPATLFVGQKEPWARTRDVITELPRACSVIPRPSRPAAPKPSRNRATWTMRSKNSSAAAPPAARRAPRTPRSG